MKKKDFVVRFPVRQSSNKEHIVNKLITIGQCSAFSNEQNPCRIGSFKTVKNNLCKT